jgi:putative hemolysin
MKLTNLHVAVGFLAALLGGVGLGFYVGYDNGWEGALRALEVQNEKQMPGIANPASTNCITLGGTLEIVEAAGGQAGYCHLEDGRVCEEWALFRDGTCSIPE